MTPQGSRNALGNAQSSPQAVHAGQRARLLRAIVEIVARDGYAEAKIGDIASCASVSRATFYELFGTKERCLLAAQRELADKVHDEAELAVVQGEAARAAHSGLLALVAFADREPREFSFLMHESMLAGSEATKERDRLMTRLAETVERAWADAPPIRPIRGCPRRSCWKAASGCWASACGATETHRDRSSPICSDGSTATWTVARR